jgi:GTP-binding protein Era
MADIVPVSALHAFNLDRLFAAIIGKLPESPPYYPKDELTDRSMRFFVSEIIREKILLLYHKEIPYSCEVSVEAYKEGDPVTTIMATVHVARESQKMILIGKNGASIKELGTQARKDIEEFIEGSVYLDLSVKVSKDWRESATVLKRFGYEA